MGTVTVETERPATGERPVPTRTGDGLIAHALAAYRVQQKKEAEEQLLNPQRAQELHQHRVRAAFARCLGVDTDGTQEEIEVDRLRWVYQRRRTQKDGSTIPAGIVLLRPCRECKTLVPTGRRLTPTRGNAPDYAAIGRLLSEAGNGEAVQDCRTCLASRWRGPVPTALQQLMTLVAPLHEALHAQDDLAEHPDVYDADDVDAESAAG